MGKICIRIVCVLCLNACGAYGQTATTSSSKGEESPRRVNALKAQINASKAQDGTLTGESWEAACRLVFLRVQTARPEDRVAVWKKGIKELPSGKVAFSSGTLADLDRLTAALGDNGFLSPSNVLNDLLERTTGADSKCALQSRLNACKFRRRFKSLPTADHGNQAIPLELRRLMLRAQFLQVRNQTSEAISVYSKVIEEHAPYSEIVRLARRQMLSLLLEQAPVDFEAAEAQLEALGSRKEPLPADLWNFTCRLAFRRVRNVAPAERKATWDKEIHRLATAGITLSDETFADLDALASALDDQGPLTAIDVLTDLLLLVPESLSMQRLQWRRIADFVKRRDWDNARKAAELDIMLATNSPEGLLAAVGKCVDIMRSSGVGEEKLKAFETSMCCAPDRGTSHTAPSASVTLRIDAPLKAAARAVLEANQRTLSSRQRGLLNAFTGNREDSLRHIHCALAGASIEGNKIDNAFDDLALVLAIADGDFHHCMRFARWVENSTLDKAKTTTRTGSDSNAFLKVLVQCERTMERPVDLSRGEARGSGTRTYAGAPKTERATFAQAVVRRWGEKLVQWGTDALRLGHTEWGAGFWTEAMIAMADSKSVESLIETLADEGRRIRAPEDTLDVFRRILSRMDAAAVRRHLLIKIATLLYEQGAFAECLKALDQADPPAGDQPAQRNMVTGFIRAVSLIRLRRFNDAVTLLDKMEGWPGSAEQHARAVFLIGWVNLQRNEKSNALSAFRRVIDTYGQTSFVGKANELIQRLEGI